jgi:DNA adenine methylase
LRYHGGKFRLAPWIIQHFPLHRVYVEPFGGAASVLLQKRPAPVEVYNDLDGQVVNVFRVLRDPKQAKELQRRLKLTAFARAELEWSYEPATDAVDEAHKIMVRSWMARNPREFSRRGRASFRNSRGDGDGGETAWYGFPGQVPAFTARLAAVAIECRPALKVIQAYDGPDTLFFVDPPYLPSTRASGQTEAEHVDLAVKLHQCAGMVVLNGYPSPLYERLYAGWATFDRTVNTAARTVVTERLWLNARAVARVHGDLFSGGEDVD